jgi:hypothetical protein
MLDDPNPDPLNLEGVDREIRIEKIHREIQEAAGTEMISGKLADCDPGWKRHFWNMCWRWNPTVLSARSIL